LTGPLWREARIRPEALIDRFVEIPPAVRRDTNLLNLLLPRLKRRRASAAIVFHGAGRPRARDVVGVVAKRAVADPAIENFEV
jgi:chloride channel protein, CIC family